MAIIPVRFRPTRDRQIEHVRVNTASPQAIGLVGLYDRRLATAVDLVTGQPTSATPPTARAVPGIGLGSLAAPNGYCSWKVPYQLPSASKAALAGWVYKTATGEISRFSANGISSDDRFVVEWSSDSNVYLAVNSTYNVFPLAGTGLHHLVCVFDGTQATHNDRLTLFVDGVAVARSSTVGTIPTTLVSTLATFDWHRDMQSSAFRYSSGYVIQSSIYSRCLTGAEAKALYDKATRWDLYQPVVGSVVARVTSASRPWLYQPHTHTLGAGFARTAW